MHKELEQAIINILHLHACEQEGIASGMPTPEQWEEGRANLEKEYLKYKRQ